MVMQIDETILSTAIGGLVTAIIWLNKKTEKTIDDVVKRLEDSIANCQKESEKKDAKILELERIQMEQNRKIGYLEGLHEKEREQARGASNKT